MSKKSNKQKDNNEKIVEKCAALGFMIGNVVWFCIYFPKDDLHFGKFILYIFIGLLIGGMLGELIEYFKYKKFIILKFKLIGLNYNPIECKF